MLCDACDRAAALPGSAVCGPCALALARSRRLPRPTAVPPGPGKVAVLRARHAARLHLYHPDDATEGHVAQPSSSVPGVNWDRRGWRVRVTVAPGIRVLLGWFRDQAEAEEAAEAWRRDGGREGRRAA